MKPFKRPAFAVAAFGIASAILPASAHALSVPAPCKEKLGWRHLRSCGEVLNRVSGNALAAPGVVASLKKNAQNRVDGWYEHKDGERNLPKDMVFCNLVGNPFASDPAAAIPPAPTNHTGESCGQYVDITVELDLDIMFGCVVGADWQTIADNRRPKGTIENSYSLSGQILATDVCLKSVLDEVKGLALHIPGSSSCTAAAQDVLQMERAFEKYKDIDYDIECLEGWEKDPEKFIKVGKGKDKQAAQMLCAARTRIESAWAQLADCEVGDRAIKKWLKEIGGAEQQKLLYDTIDKEISQKCGTKCVSEFSACGNIPTTASFSACVNKCYQERIAPFFTKYLSERFRSCQ